MNVHELLRLMVERRASDLHLRVPSPPVLRIDGSLVPLQDLPNVVPEDTQRALEEMATEARKEAFYRDLELDFAYSIAGLARFRVNAFFQRGTISLAIRKVSLEMPTMEELGLPPVCRTLALKSKGLVLVTGPTGSGKSTTLAAMINHLNESDSRNVITIEDPIEFAHQNNKCLIAQRDLGDDTRAFSVALSHALRQDPDVILVGEMRDLDTISTAITAAETGHLVLSTLHTISAPQTIERVVDVFPASQQEQIRCQLSLVLEGVISQILLPRQDGDGRVAAFEVMLGTDAVRSLIREGKIDQIPTFLQTGKQYGMQTMEQSLQDMVSSGVVALEDALKRSARPDDLQERVPLGAAARPLQHAMSGRSM
jgi:twitching motility protein PilT